MTDNFFDIDFGSGKGKFEKTRFLDFSIGNHTVRLIGKPEKIFVHFLRGRGTVKCLGSDSPICKNNKSLMAEYPDDFDKKPGYNKSSPRHYMNVLDRTVVKTCPQCGYETVPNMVGNYPATCKCGTFITDVTPAVSDKIKVANISHTNATTLSEYHKSILDKDGNIIGLNNYDITFMVTATGQTKNIVPIPNKDNIGPVDVPEDALYDLSKCVISLEADEIVHLMQGVSLKDIFAGRKAVKSSVPSEVATATVEVVEASINDLFKEG